MCCKSFTLFPLDVPLSISMTGIPNSRILQQKCIKQNNYNGCGSNTNLECVCQGIQFNQAINPCEVNGCSADELQSTFPHLLPIPPQSLTHPLPIPSRSRLWSLQPLTRGPRSCRIPSRKTLPARRRRPDQSRELHRRHRELDEWHERQRPGPVHRRSGEFPEPWSGACLEWCCCGLGDAGALNSELVANAFACLNYTTETLMLESSREDAGSLIRGRFSRHIYMDVYIRYS